MSQGRQRNHVHMGLQDPCVTLCMVCVCGDSRDSYYLLCFWIFWKLRDVISKETGKLWRRVHCCILCFRITMGSFPLRNLLEKAKDDEERLTLEIIFMMSNVTPVGQGKNKRRRGTPIDRTEAAFNVFDSDKVFSHTNFNSPTRLLLKVGCETRLHLTQLFVDPHSHHVLFL